MTKTEARKRAIKAWCAGHGKTQTWLAKRVGVHHSRFSRIVCGYEKAPDDLVDLVRELTGVSLRDEEMAVRS